MENNMSIREYYPTKEAFEKLGKKDLSLDGKDAAGKPAKFVLLTDDRIAMIKEGTGKDVEMATLIAGGDQSKYFSALMAGTIEINGEGIISEDLANLSMKNYMRIQVAFSEVNF